MRVLLVAALLLSTASCAWAPPPPQAAAPAPPGPVALVPPPSYAPPPAMAAAPVPVPPPAPAAPAVVVAYQPEPGPLLHLISTPTGRLTLSNFTFDAAHIQAVVTTAPLCGPGAGGAASDFVLPLNGTRVIQAPPGADVCWRRANQSPAGEAAAPAPPWTGWNRAFTSSGRTIDAQL